MNVEGILRDIKRMKELIELYEEKLRRLEAPTPNISPFLKKDKN